MNPEIKAEWVKRLRSGQYEQGRSALSYQGSYCCLGVLCEIAAERGIVIKTTHGDDGVTYDNATVLLPIKVIKWAGLSDSAPVIGHEKDLTVLNDLMGYDFNDIANVIERGA